MAKPKRSKAKLTRKPKFSHWGLLLVIIPVVVLGAYFVHRSHAYNADVTGDGKVDIADLSTVARNYGGTNRTHGQGDINGDGATNIADLSILAANWGAAPALTNRDRIGTGGGFYGTVPQDQFWAAFQKENFGWARIDVTFNMINQPIDKIDANLNHARDLHLKVMPVLDYSFETNETNNGHHAPSDPQAWANYAGRLVAHWQSQYPGLVKAVEVWNEANQGGAWANPDPVKYTDLLRRTYQAVHAVDPNIIVVSSGLAQTPANPVCDFSQLLSMTHNNQPGIPTSCKVNGDYASSAYLKVIYDHKAAGETIFDAVGVHPYDTNLGANGNGNNLWSNFHQTFFMRKIMNHYSDNGKQIWGTEAGWKSCPGGNLSETQRVTDAYGDLDDWFHGKHSASSGWTVAANSSEATLDWNVGPFFIYKLFKNEGDGPEYGLVYTRDADIHCGHPDWYEPPIVDAMTRITNLPQNQPIKP
jgi:hypothetical protein